MAQNWKNDDLFTEFTNTELVIAYLDQGIKLKEKIESLDYERIMLRTQATALPSAAQVMSEKVSRSAPTEAFFTNSIVKANDVEERINAQQEELRSLHVQIIEVINRSLPILERKMLIQRYIEGKQWQEIASEVHCATRTLYRYRDEALQRIILPDDAIWLDDTKNVLKKKAIEKRIQRRYLPPKAK